MDLQTVERCLYTTESTIFLSSNIAATVYSNMQFTVATIQGCIATNQGQHLLHSAWVGKIVHKNKEFEKSHFNGLKS